MPDNLQEQLDTYLTDVHAMELQALEQMRAAPGLAGDAEIARAFSDHERETEGHERRVRERLEARGAAPSKLKDVAGRVTAVPFVLFAKSQPDTTRLRARGAAPSRLKDAAMRLGALNWAAFFAAQPDTPGKLAGFAYAFEHLEIGAYEHLKRVAQRAGDGATEGVAERILGQERFFAERLEPRFDVAIDASLRVQGVLA